MYKILILKRQSETDPLWTTYMTPDATGPVEFVAETEEDLSVKLNELLATVPKNNIKIYKDMSFMIDVILSDDA